MNNINRDNYETFFLLYADNELPAAEKRAVDEFVIANPDLQEELVMLQQSILQPENIVFQDKNSLLKNEFIPTRLQEILLLHLDNELTTIEKNEINGLIKADVGIKEEWDILQQTKILPVGSVVFKDKASLYRKERDRVVAFPWWKVAAAAVFIGFGIWGGLVYFNREAETVDRATVIKTPAKTAQDTLSPGSQQSTQQAGSSFLKDKEVTTARLNPAKPSSKTITRSHEMATPRLIARDERPPVVFEKNNNLPKPYSGNINRIERNETVPESVIHEKQISGNSDIVKSFDNHDPVNAYATSFTDNPEENNNQILFIGEEKIKKSKLGGFFRKVKRVLERSANIKPGDNNIKVANLEFAIQ